MRLNVLLSSLLLASVMSVGISFSAGATEVVSSANTIATPTIVACFPRYC